MRKTGFLLIVFALVLSASLANAYDDGDFQVWSTFNEEFKVNKEAKIGLEEEFRWADNANEFFYHHYDVGAAYSPKKWLSTGGGYRHIYELKSGKFKQENAPYITAGLLWNIKDFKFEDKHRFEYRHFDYQADAWRYRNKLTAVLPWEFTALRIKPYVSDEMLFSLSATNQLNQNRLSSGIALSLTENIKAETYYMLVTSKSRGKWTDANVLGAKVKVAF